MYDAYKFGYQKKRQHTWKDWKEEFHQYGYMKRETAYSNWKKGTYKKRMEGIVSSYQLPFPQEQLVNSNSAKIKNNKLYAMPYNYKLGKIVPRIKIQKASPPKVDIPIQLPTSPIIDPWK